LCGNSPQGWSTERGTRRYSMWLAGRAETPRSWLNWVAPSFVWIRTKTCCVACRTIHGCFRCKWTWRQIVGHLVEASSVESSRFISCYSPCFAGLRVHCLRVGFFTYPPGRIDGFRLDDQLLIKRNQTGEVFLLRQHLRLERLQGRGQCRRAAGIWDIEFWPIVCRLSQKRRECPAGLSSRASLRTPSWLRASTRPPGRLGF
jgi:hypothetical protein